MKKLLAITLIINVLVVMTVHAEPTKKVELRDISEHWAKQSIERMISEDVVNGFPDGRFLPNEEVSRAQFVKMLVQVMGYKKVDNISFTDIKPLPTSKPHWAAVYIETALRNGVIVKEEIGESFFPNVPLTRIDMAMMMARALELQPSTGENPFVDVVQANGYAIKLFEEYLIRGSLEGGKRLYKPEGLTTRAEAAVIISRMKDYKAGPKGYVEKAAMDERLKNGTYTADDLAVVTADPNYIIEPKIRILNKLEDFAGFADKWHTAEQAFSFTAGYIALDNYEDYLNYTPECQFRLVCTDKDKDLLNTITKLTQPFISYDHVYEVRTDGWQKTKDLTAYYKEVKTYPIEQINRLEEKAVNGKWTGLPDFVKAGDKLHYTLSIKRGNNTKDFSIVFDVN